MTIVGDPQSLPVPEDMPFPCALCHRIFLLHGGSPQFVGVMDLQDETATEEPLCPDCVQEWLVPGQREYERQRERGGGA